MQGEAPDTAVVRTSDPVRAAAVCDHLVQAGIPGFVRQSPVHEDVEFPYEVWVPRARHDLARELVRQFDEEHERRRARPFDWEHADVERETAEGDPLDP